jgi:hypothetical protein
MLYNVFSDISAGNDNNALEVIIMRYNCILVTAHYNNALEVIIMRYNCILVIIMRYNCILVIIMRWSDNNAI